MAERNWRDEFETHTDGPYEVLSVFYYQNEPVCALASYLPMGTNELISAGRLIPKPKPKTYRPWKDEEVPVGSVVVTKHTGEKGIITACRPRNGFPIACSIGGEWRTASFFEKFTMLDGSPCGTLES